VLQKKPEHELLILGFFSEIMMGKSEFEQMLGCSTLRNLEKDHKYVKNI